MNPMTPWAADDIDKVRHQATLYREARDERAALEARANAAGDDCGPCGYVVCECYRCKSVPVAQLRDAMPVFKPMPYTHLMEALCGAMLAPVPRSILTPSAEELLPQSCQHPKVANHDPGYRITLRQPDGDKGGRLEGKALTTLRPGAKGAFPGYGWRG